MEAERAAQERGYDHLERIERAAMTANEHSKVSAIDIEDELAVVSVVLIDARTGLTEVGKDVLDRADGCIGDEIELVVGELLACLVLLLDRGSHIGRGFGSVRLSLGLDFFLHVTPPG